MENAPELYFFRSAAQKRPFLCVDLREGFGVMHFEHLLIDLPHSSGLLGKRYQTVVVGLPVFVHLLEHGNVLHFRRQSVAGRFDHFGELFPGHGRRGLIGRVVGMRPRHENALRSIPFCHLKKST